MRWETGEARYHAQIKAENHARIIRAARDLFLAQGYDKTSLAQITREARVSTGTLFMRSTSSRLRPAIPGTA
ncbi:helix-turn-helix domain-containing protein [Streptomyces sp. NPDC050121]|uniref:helix-turn-helix domain-containing protein n=1 Tax=Streptomyces sp. NPDC050121 TaxID=3365601 RepID=UPI003789BA9A